MYDHVLVATDGSEAVQDAIDEAIDLAALADATLHALYVVDTTDHVVVPDAELLAVEETLENAAERAVEDVRERAADAGVAVRTAVRHGSPAEGILAYAGEHDVDLVVVGSRGRSALDRVLLGSVSETVVRNADRPVLVSGGPESDAE